MKGVIACLHSVLRVWIVFSAIALAAQNNTDISNNPSTPVRLAAVQQCPASPKPMCEDVNCQGATFRCATQFLCSNETPFTGSDGRDLILAGCSCCPRPIEVECTDCKCAAPEGTRVCVAELLRGCTCMTVADRVELMRKTAANHVWTSDDEFEIDIEPVSDEEDEENSARVSVPSPSVSMATTILATMDHGDLGLLRDYWATELFGKLS
jgi:hypothetical protein